MTGRLTHLHLDPAAAREPSAERMVLTRRPGDPVTAAPHAAVTDRLAHWVATADTPAQCVRALRHMSHHLTATVHPAPTPTRPSARHRFAAVPAARLALSGSRRGGPASSC
ncbi:hypothetical protein ACFQ3Z_15100 [Streptomyces nogalater]